MKSHGNNFLLKVTKNGQVVDRVQTHSIRVFLPHLRSIKWQDRGIKAYFRVSYGVKLTNQGSLETFYNDGWYESKDDLVLAYEAFTENRG